MKGNVTFTILGIEVWRITAEHETPNTPPSITEPFKDAATQVGQKVFHSLGKILFR